MKKERKFKKEQILVYLIAFVMIGSTFGVMFYGFSGTSTELTYGKFTFSREQSPKNKWYTKIDGKTIYFDYFPTEVESINLSQEISNRLLNSVEIDFTYYVNDTKKDVIAYSGYDMQQQLVPKNIYVRIGFTTKSEYNVPVITCEDATPAVPVLYLKRTNETKIYPEGNCVILEAATDLDILRLKDRILYSVLGVMK